MDEQRADPQVTTAADTVAELHRFLADSLSLQRLYGILRAYVRKAEIVALESVDDEAYELLQNVVVKAFEIADKYRGVGIRPWLLSIAKNLIKQKRESQARHQQRVILLGEMHLQTHPSISEEEFFDLFTAQIAEERAQIADLREDLKDALACLSVDDQTILNFYIHYGFDHNEIAHILQIKPGAARTRYFRALARLYNIWVSQDENRRGENNA
ncbi:MAG TPA: RNA polymerase sigma factor [Ktedonosporobacter sp.]|jgi:RNA polymerase sigma factor (sigma-70 family)|nr:RNA polymerase sigma factor [Ktedonosporobacter sp.]